MTDISSLLMSCAGKKRKPSLEGARGQARRFPDWVTSRQVMAGTLSRQVTGPDSFHAMVKQTLEAPK